MVLSYLKGILSFWGFLIVFISFFLLSISLIHEGS